MWRSGAVWTAQQPRRLYDEAFSVSDSSRPQHAPCTRDGTGSALLSDVPRHAHRAALPDCGRLPASLCLPCLRKASSGSSEIRPRFTTAVTQLLRLPIDADRSTAGRRSHLLCPRSASDCSTKHSCDVLSCMHIPHATGICETGRPTRRLLNVKPGMAGSGPVTRGTERRSGSSGSHRRPAEQVQGSCIDCTRVDIARLLILLRARRAGDHQTRPARTAGHAGRAR